VVLGLYMTSVAGESYRRVASATSTGRCLRTSENSRYAKFALRSPDEIGSADVFMDSCLLWVRLCCVIPSFWVKTNGATKPAIRMVLLDHEDDVGWGTVRPYNLNAAVWRVMRCLYYTSLLACWCQEVGCYGGSTSDRSS
jgi:hypothetical protein